MNQYVKSQQMMEAHRSAGLAYGKMYRNITNELSLRRDQRSNVFEFLKIIRSEQDRLESTSPAILPRVITKFNKVFAERQIEKPEIAGDLDETQVNTDAKETRLSKEKKKDVSRTRRSPVMDTTLKYVNSAANVLFPTRRAEVVKEDEELFKKSVGSKIYDEEKKAEEP